MITEIVLIEVKPGSGKDFEAAVETARPLLLRAKGNKGFELQRSIEKPSRYRVLVKWEKMDNHADFQRSEDFTALGALLGPHLATPPEIEHTETMLAA